MGLIIGDEMKIKIKYPVEEKYIPVAYYLGWVVEGVAEIREIREGNKHWEIEIYDKEGASLGEFSCPLEWIENTNIVLSAEEYLKTISLNDLENNHDEAMAIYRAGGKAQWINHQKLREAVENYIQDRDMHFHESGIIEAYENIKPLDQ